MKADAEVVPADEVLGKKRGRKSKAEKAEELQKEMEQAQQPAAQTKDEDPEIASIRASLERITKKNAPKAAAEDAPIITDRPKEVTVETLPIPNAKAEEAKVATAAGRTSASSKIDELTEYLIDAAEPLDDPKEEDYNPEFVKAMKKAAEKHMEETIEKITAGDPDNWGNTYSSPYVKSVTAPYIMNEEEMKEAISVAESGDVIKIDPKEFADFFTEELKKKGIDIAAKAEDDKVVFDRVERRHTVVVPAKDDLMDRLTYILDVQRGKRTVPTLVSFSVTGGIRYVIVDVNVNLVEDAWKEYKADRRDKSNPEEFMDMLYKILHTSIPRMYRAVAPIHLK